MPPMRPPGILEPPLPIERDRAFIEVDDAELHRHAGAGLARDPGERLRHQPVRDALALPWRADDQPVDLRHGLVRPIHDDETGQGRIVLGDEDSAMRMRDGFAGGALGDGDDALVLRDLLRRQVRAIERVLDRLGDEGVQVLEVGCRAGRDAEHAALNNTL